MEIKFFKFEVNMIEPIIFESVYNQEIVNERLTSAATDDVTKQIAHEMDLLLQDTGTSAVNDNSGRKTLDFDALFHYLNQHQERYPHLINVLQTNFIEYRNEDFNSKSSPYEQNKSLKYLDKQERIDFQERFLLIGQQAIRELYQEPYPLPENVTIVYKGQSVLWNQLTQEDQTLIIETYRVGSESTLFIPYEGSEWMKEFLPRWRHGSVHVLRTGIFVRLAADLLLRSNPQLRISEEEIIIAQFLTLFHESARQAEGVDVWSDQSADHAKKYLLLMGCHESTADRLIEILKQKQDVSHTIREALQRGDEPDLSDYNRIAILIDSADSLDRMRLEESSQYEFERNAIYHYARQNGHVGELLRLFNIVKSEIVDLIAFTEKPLAKLFIDQVSKNVVSDIRSVVESSHVKQNDEKVPRFPLIASLYLGIPEKLPKMKKSLKYCLKSKENIGDQPTIDWLIVKRLSGGVHFSQLILNFKEEEMRVHKKLTEQQCLQESGASKIAHELSNGLVPIAEVLTLNQGEPKETFLIVQQFKDIYKSYFNPKNFTEPHFKINFEHFDDRQKAQLFSHMIVDWVICNYDAHNGQFGIDRQGNVIGYDKGAAFKHFKGSHGFKEPKKFNPDVFWHPLWPNIYTYHYFAKYLSAHPAILTDILASEIVQETFKRCKALTEQDLKKHIEDYRQRVGYDELKFYKHILDRGQNIELEILEYFFDKSEEL